VKRTMSSPRLAAGHTPKTARGREGLVLDEFVEQRAGVVEQRETTVTARDASSTCTTVIVLGAIFTAVCWRLVVAPPISSGLHAAALHLLGHVHHLVERRRDEAREADHVGAFGSAASRILSHETITPRSTTS
jgi:hypothetical protein